MVEAQHYVTASRLSELKYLLLMNNKKNKRFGIYQAQILPIKWESTRFLTEGHAT